MSHILIAEDNAHIASFIEKGLRAAGYQTEIASTGTQTLELAKYGGFDLMILDIGLPEIDGFEVLERLRGEGQTLPVIILSARDSVTDTVTGLEGGANDYVTKPFEFAELLARVRLRLREESTTSQAVASSTLHHEDMELDLHTRQVTSQDGQADLTSREFAMLEVFMRNPGHVLSRQQLLGHVWGIDFDTGSNVVDVCVRGLRRKIGAHRIETVRGAGYRLG